MCDIKSLEGRLLERWVQPEMRSYKLWLVKGRMTASTHSVPQKERNHPAQRGTKRANRATDDLLEGGPMRVLYAGKNKKNTSQSLSKGGPRDLPGKGDWIYGMHPSRAFLLDSRDRVWDNAVHHWPEKLAQQAKVC